MRVYNDEIVTEPFIPLKDEPSDDIKPGKWRLILASDTENNKYIAQLAKGWLHQINPDEDPEDPKFSGYELDNDCVAFVDYYVEKVGVQ